MLRRSFVLGAVVVSILVLAERGTPRPARAANFNVPAGDTAALITAITTANTNNQDDVISLAAGSTYTLSSVHSVADGDNGLPSILPDGGHTLTIDGNGATIVREALAPNFRILHIAATANLALIDLEISNGASSSFGGGIRNAGTLSMMGGSVDNGLAELGGGIYNEGSATLSGTSLSGNQAGLGGGMYNEGIATLTGVTVSANSVISVGGGIYNQASSSVTLVNSTVTGNSALNDGGGIFNGGVLTISGSALTTNSATQYGGGIHSSDQLGEPSVTVTTSTIMGNSAELGGGISNQGDLEVRRSTLASNSATEWGGGIYSVDDLEVVNSTLSGNSAGTGGGGIANTGFATLVNSTFSANNTLQYGGAIWNGGEAYAANLIVVNALGASNCQDDGQFFGVGGNFSDDASCPSFTQVVSAGIGPLAANGGPTMTHALLPGSAAIDAGDEAYCANELQGVDQRGLPRPATDCDAGAFEVQSPAPALPFRLFVPGVTRH